MPAAANPIRPTDHEARALGRRLLTDARFGALGVTLDTGAPMVTRIAVATDSAGIQLTLISSLSMHTRALMQAPTCSLLVGEPGAKGDPLNHPRLTLQCVANFVDRTRADHTDLRARYLDQQPKAKLYIDFGDFSLVRLKISRAYLNGGFGQAYHLTAADLMDM